MVCRGGAMGALRLNAPAFVSQDGAFGSRNGGELSSRGGVPLPGASRDCPCRMRSFVPASRSMGCSSSSGSSNSIGLISGGFTKNDRCLEVHDLGRLVGMWSNMKMTRRRSRTGRGLNRGWEPLVENRNRIVMRAGGDKNDSNSGDDQVETLFMRELRRRGMSKEKDGSSLGSAGTDTKTKEEGSEAGRPFGSGWSLPGASKTKPPQLTESQRDDQLKRSMALNSEGLDGLIPRATELLKLGSTFFLVSWPFILASLAAFVAVYLYFGSAFIHTGDDFDKAGRPPYVDPYQLLEEEELVGPNRVPYNFKAQRSSP